MTEITIQTTVKCCGELHSTPFCPSCGRSLIEELPLVQLLHHVSKSARRAKTNAGDGSRRRLREASAKWEAWRAALSEVVNRPKKQTNE